MKYSTQHKYQCSEAYDKWALKNIKNVIHKPTARQAYMDACRTCIEGFNEWIGMESAPKGGGAELVTDDKWIEPPEILLLFSDGKRSVGYWDWYCAEGGEGYTGGSAWTDPVSGEQLHLSYDEPIGWMPLPEPPYGNKDTGGMMFIDEKSSPLLKSAYEHGKEEGIKEGMERAMDIIKSIKLYPGTDDEYQYIPADISVLVEAIRKEIK